MNSTDKKQIQLHKMELDEKYLSRKLTEIIMNNQIIRSNLKRYKNKFKVKDKKKLFILEKALIKILAINRRTLRLLIQSDFIECNDLFGVSLFTVKDIEYFLNTTIKKHRN
jgi:hypothetical protein